MIGDLGLGIGADQRARLTPEMAHADHPDLHEAQVMLSRSGQRTDRRFALRLRLRSVTNYGRDLPPDGHSRQAEEFQPSLVYRAAPAT